MKSRSLVSVATDGDIAGIRQVSSPLVSPLYNFLNIQPETLKVPFIRPDSQDSLSPLLSKSSSKGTFSRSSAFCNLSSSSSSETQKHLGNTLPFLPNPFTYSSTLESERSAASFSEDLSNPFDGGFLTLSGDACSDGAFHDLDCPNENFSYSEQMELQFLSDDLELAITDSAETPRLDEIYETPLPFSDSVTGLSPGQNCVPPSMSVSAISSHNCPGSAVNNKPRMRWTPELHESFLEAVKKLQGPEKATPKAVMKLMNVEGLTIYQVKSHLQKYRLAKYMPERKEEKKNVSSEDKKPDSSSSDGDKRKKGAIQITEALRMQMEVQKQLHEQLETQRSLQLRIEEHARYLEKIIEEQRKAGTFIISSTNSKQEAQIESKTDAKHKAFQVKEDECETPPKRSRL